MSLYKFSKVFALSLVLLVGWAGSSYAASGSTLGGVIKNTYTAFDNFPSILSAFAYLAGLFLAVSGLYKFKEHVDAPHQTPLSAGVKRFLVGGMFLSLPYMFKAVK